MVHLAAARSSKVILHAGGTSPRCHHPAAHILRSVAMALGDKSLLDSALQISPSRAGPGPATLAIFSHVLHNAEVDEHLHIFISQLFPGAQ